jgi:hypothetical protein
VVGLDRGTRDQKGPIGYPLCEEASGGEAQMARDDETERYRQAAEAALQQLDWCIDYLHGIRKPELSARLAQNRTQMKRQLMRESA